MESPADAAVKDKPDYTIRAVERVCQILDLLQQSDDVISLVDVADATGLPKSSAFRYLATLEARRYVERDPVSGDFRIGLALLPLQAKQLDLLVQRATPHLQHLSDTFEETANLGLLDGNRVVYLKIVESPKGVRLAARTGDRERVHSTALGKAICAGLPEEKVQAMLTAEGMPKATDRTITNPGKYLAELKRVRDRGYALDDRENEPDGRCVAVPLTGLQLPAAISLSAPSVRLPLNDVDQVVTALTEVAEKLTEPAVAAD